MADLKCYSFKFSFFTVFLFFLFSLLYVEHDTISDRTCVMPQDDSLGVDDPKDWAPSLGGAYNAVIEKIEDFQDNPTPTESDKHSFSLTTPPSNFFQQQQICFKISMFNIWYIIDVKLLLSVLFNWSWAMIQRCTLLEDCDDKLMIFKTWFWLFFHVQFVTFFGTTRNNKKHY